ncbi:MAG: hypothetical protein RL885_28160 [Planctomycetota bacterium]
MAKFDSRNFQERPGGEFDEFFEDMLEILRDEFNGLADDDPLGDLIMIHAHRKPIRSLFSVLLADGPELTTRGIAERYYSVHYGRALSRAPGDARLEIDEVQQVIEEARALLSRIGGTLEIGDQGTWKLDY